MTSTVETGEVAEVTTETVESSATSKQAVVGMVGLRSGKTHILKRESTRAGVPESPRSVNDAGVIYTSTEDMPSLEELLLRKEVAFAVLEREVVASAVYPTRRPRPESGRTRWPLVAAALAAGATTSAGWLALVDAVDDDALNANPYTALSLALGGIVLIATLLTALKSDSG